MPRRNEFGPRKAHSLFLCRDREFDSQNFGKIALDRGIGFHYDPPMRLRFISIVMLLVVASLLFCGCVRRRMTVRSNPPGAMVYLDGKEIGKTPFSTNFDFYGKREFRVVKEGYETKTVLLEVWAPWYEWIGIDFFSEVLLPGKLTDRHYYEFDMQPESVVPPSELFGRAEDLRRIAQANGTMSANNASRISAVPSTPSGSISPPPNSQYSPYIPNQSPQYAPPETTPTYPTPIVQPNPYQPIQPPATNPDNPNTYMPPRI